jgi:hypothetical protein
MTVRYYSSQKYGSDKPSRPMRDLSSMELLNISDFQSGTFSNILTNVILYNVSFRQGFGFLKIVNYFVLRQSINTEVVAQKS